MENSSINFQEIKSKMTDIILASNGNGSGTITDVGDYLILKLECAIKKDERKEENHLTLN